MNKKDYNISRILKDELMKRNNPKDLKSIHLGLITKVSPVTVTIYDGKVVLSEGDNLYISEWFRFRCNINKTGKITDKLQESQQNCDNAKQIKEIHSYGGAECNMPNAISFLATAIEATNFIIENEFLPLKCNLQLNDYVIIGSLEQLDKFILLDKLIPDNYEFYDEG